MTPTEDTHTPGEMEMWITEWDNGNPMTRMKMETWRELWDKAREFDQLLAESEAARQAAEARRCANQWIMAAGYVGHPDSERPEAGKLMTCIEYWKKFPDPVPHTLCDSCRALTAEEAG